MGTTKNKSLATIYIYVYFFLEIIKFYDKTANWLLMMIRGNEESVRVRIIIVTSPARALSALDYGLRLAKMMIKRYTPGLMFFM